MMTEHEVPFEVEREAADRRKINSRFKRVRVNRSKIKPYNQSR